MALLGSALLAGGVQAAEQVERPDPPAPPATPAPPAPRAATPALPQTPPTPPRASSEVSPAEKASREELDRRLEEAQARLQRAASEVAALAAERAADAMENFTWFGGASRRTVIGVQLDDSGKEGPKVQDVSPGGPAELAGIRAGDVIVSINGKDVKGASARDVSRLLRDVQPESKVKVRLMRDGKSRDVEVVARPYDPRTFAYRPAPPGPNSSDFPFRFDPNPDPLGPDDRVRPFAWGGSYRHELVRLELTTLTPQLGRYFGTEKGVLVVRAPQSEIFKLQEGDVILSIDGREPSSGSHITRILSSYQPGEKLTLRVMRDRKPLDIQITLPDDDRKTARTHERTAWQDAARSLEAL